MKSKSLILMIVSLGFGLIAAIGISKVMGRTSAPAAPAMTMGPVLVATKTLKHGEELTEECLKIENWPIQIIPEEAATSFEEVENMAITTPLSKGLAILKTDILNKSEIHRVNIRPGHKVVAIKVSADDTIGGLLAPGDKIDVIGVVQVRDQENSRDIRTVSKTFLKNITVFSVNDKMKVGGERVVDGGKNNSIVSVLLNERQAEMIVLVQSVAELKIVMRGDDYDEADPDEGDFAGGEETLSVFGFGKESKGDTQTIGMKDSNENFVMKIHSGGEYHTYRFIGGVRVEEPKMDQESNSADPDNYDASNDLESGLEEDQYPGE